MNLNQLQTFVHVAEHGSFSKAALVLGVAQPALSRQVRALETELHETLLLRHGRGVQVTDAGRRLLEHCQDILHMVSRAKEDLLAQRNEPIGVVTIAMPPTVARLHTLPLIRAFQAEMPRARLAIVEGFSVLLTEWLLTGRTDLALIYSPEPQAALDIVPLRRERLCLISAAGQAPGKTVSVQQLARYPLVVPQRGQIFRNLMESAAAMAGVQLNVAWEVSSVPVILDLVASGMGHAALGEEAIRSYEHPERLAVTPLTTPFAEAGIVNTLCLVTAAHKRTTPLTLRTAALLRRIITGA
ncbi:MAG: LysR family transcriptional regulator [Rhodocyclaceae bacterium]